MMSKLKKAKIRWASAALAMVMLMGCSSPSNQVNSTSQAQSQKETAATSQETGNSTAAATTQVSTSVPTNSNSVVYKNTQYGFSFTLPGSWKGYSTVNSEWQGTALEGGTAETGPMISIRDPRWTSQTPRQDIPIMILTLGQWNSLQQEKFHIGAAPVNPTELGRNNRYVFALPARYNYAFPPGFEEVENILKGNPLKTTQLSEQNTDPKAALISDIMALGKQGKIINCDFSAKANTIEDVQKAWGSADKSDYVEAADGTYFTYSAHSAVFGVNKGDQIFEARSFDSRLKGITLTEAKKVLGTPAHDAKGTVQEIIGYTAGSEFKVEMVFPLPTSSNPDPAMDHYNVLYPSGTVNSMKGDPGREW